MPSFLSLQQQISHLYFYGSLNLPISLGLYACVVSKSLGWTFMNPFLGWPIWPLLIESNLNLSNITVIVLHYYPTLIKLCHPPHTPQGPNPKLQQTILRRTSLITIFSTCELIINSFHLTLGYSPFKVFFLPIYQVENPTSTYLELLWPIDDDHWAMIHYVLHINLTLSELPRARHSSMCLTIRF